MSSSGPTGCTIISYGDSSDGTDRAYLRLAEAGEELTFQVSKVSDKHRSFLLSTWVRSAIPSIRKVTGNSSQISQDRMVEEEASRAESLWKLGSVVHGKDDDYTVYAWIVGEQGVLHYVYVVPELRKKGVAEALIESVCGHNYETGRQWPGKRLPNAGKYNPYLLGYSG